MMTCDRDGGIGLTYLDYFSGIISF